MDITVGPSVVHFTLMGQDNYITSCTLFAKIPQFILGKIAQWGPCFLLNNGLTTYLVCVDELQCSVKTITSFVICGIGFVYYAL